MNVSANTSERREAMKRFATFFIEETLLGVDIGRVQEINEEPVVTKVPLARVYVLGIMNLRGQIITIIDLRRKMGLASPGPAEGKAGVMIVNWKGEHVGLLFDRIGDVVEADEARIEAPPANISGASEEFFQGVLTTARQRIVALLDIDSVLADDES